MAGNPKYGLTYKTSDGKTKTLTGINLGTGSYTSEQITAFVGIVAEVTNKTVTALDITAANAIPPPEPQKDLIESFTVLPSTLSATIGGDPVTAEIAITTSPQDANYQLSIPDAPAWVSIDDTTVIFAPPAGTAPNHYLFTVVAITKDDSAEFAITLEVKEKEKPINEITYTKKTDQDTKPPYPMHATITGTANAETIKVGWTEINGKGLYFSSSSATGNPKKKSVYVNTRDSIDAAASALVTLATSTTSQYIGSMKKIRVTKNNKSAYFKLQEEE